MRSVYRKHEGSHTEWIAPTGVLDSGEPYEAVPAVAGGGGDGIAPPGDGVRVAPRAADEGFGNVRVRRMIGDRRPLDRFAEAVKVGGSRPGASLFPADPDDEILRRGNRGSDRE